MVADEKREQAHYSEDEMEGEICKNDDNREESEDENNVVQKSSKLRHSGSITQIFKVFCYCELRPVFPIMAEFLKIAVTRPVTSTTGTHVFKNETNYKIRLRSIMESEPLGSFLIIAMEKHIEIDDDEVIKTFVTFIHKNRTLAKLCCIGTKN